MLISLDTETDLITDECAAPAVACVQIADEHDTTILHWSDCEYYVNGILRDPQIKIVGHTIAYDMACIASTWPYMMRAIFDAYENDRIQDVAINAKLWDIACGKPPRGYGLDDLTARYLKRTVDKDNPWRMRFGELRHVPLDQWPAEALQYALNDARVTFDIARTIEGKAGQVLGDRYRQARADWWLRLGSNRGLATNANAVQAFEHELRAKHEVTAKLLLSNGLARETKKGLTRNTKAAKARMVQVWRGELPRTASGDVSLSGEHLEESGDPLLEAYAAFSSISKKLSTDVPILYRPVIRTRFDVLKDTGRTGSSNPNVQNFDRNSGIRECFVPREGFTFANADYGKGELCTWSQVCLWLFGRSRMADALNNGLDPHLEIAALIAGVPYEQALARIKDDTIDNARQAGKVCNFGFPGGMGVESFCAFAKKGYGVQLTPDQARMLKRHWQTAWPEARQYLAWIGSLIGDGSSVTMQHFISGRYRGGCRYTQACNTLFQGLLADAGKHAGFHIARECYVDDRSPLYGSHIVNFIHDEFLTEVPLDRAHWAAERQAQIMVERAAEFIPDVTPQAEPLLASCWSKRAKPVRDEKGLLIPWQS